MEYQLNMESWCQASGGLCFLEHFSNTGGKVDTQATDELFNPSQAVTKPGAESSVQQCSLTL